MENLSKRPTITGDLQNVFNYAFIETASYHFIVPKPEKYISVHMTDKINHCMDCGNDLKVQYNENGLVYIANNRMEKQKKLYEKYHLQLPKLGEENFTYFQDGYCAICAQNHIYNQSKGQDVCNACMELNQLDEGLMINAQDLIEKVVHTWIYGIKSKDELKNLDLSTYLAIRELICGVIFGQKDLLDKILQVYQSKVAEKKILIQSILDEIATPSFAGYVARPTTVYETMDDNLYNEYTVVFPSESTPEENFYVLKEVEKNRVAMFLGQKRIESVDELLSETIFSDIWIEWLMQHLNNLK